MGDNKIQSGKVLLAEPYMLDPHFKRAAVLLCDHHEEGSIGLIMNKPVNNMKVDQVIDDFPEFDVPMFYGGPVQTDTLHYVHNVGDLLEESIKIIDGVWWGGNFEKLKFLIASSLILPQNIRFFMGYSGWGEDQLADELTFGSWVVTDMDPNYLFKIKPENLWKQAMQNKGDHYTVIAQMPEDMNWN